MSKKNKIFIITGPSGAGEDSVIKELQKYFPIEKIVTSTTRKKRPNEIAGKDYYFLSHEKFQEKIKNNKFFEWALEDNENYYGGTYEEIERVLNSTNIGIWKIDYQGVLNAKKIIPEAISIYLHVPIKIIEKRLNNRGIHNKKFIEERLDYAQGWYQNRDKFDYEVENKEGELDKTIEKVAKIIKKNIK
jgi:guanylate kinase